MTDTTTKKILLVDDSVTTLLMARMILEASPHLHLVTAENGEEAVSAALRERPDLILMDVVMPRMNGLQACRAIRSSDEIKEIPVILVTPRGEEGLYGYDSGCTAYITKPFNSAELMALVKAHLGEA